MNKKTNSIIFLVAATIFNVVLTVIIIGLLILGTTFVLNKAGIIEENPIILMVDWTLCLVGGMVLSLFLYSKCINWFIIKFNLEDKLDGKILGKKQSSNKNSAIKEERPKTVIPQSALPKEEI